MVTYSQLDIQTATWQGQLNILNQLKGSGVNPANLLEINEQVQQAASDVITSQKELIALQKSENEALLARIKVLEANPLPPQFNPMKMEDEGKVAELDAAVSVPAISDDQGEVANLINGEMFLQALQEYPISGQNMDDMLECVGDKLNEFAQQLRRTFFRNEYGYEAYVPNCLYVKDLRGDAEEMGEILAHLVKQKNNMNRLQQDRAYAIINHFKDSISIDRLDKDAEEAGYNRIDDTLAVIGIMNQEAFGLFIEGLKPDPDPDAVA